MENYAQIVETRDEKTGRKKVVQIWPRFHQLELVRRLLADARVSRVAKRYLIQHSAGSGKSNSIAWLAHQLIGLKNEEGKEVFDSILVVTDRRILDRRSGILINQFSWVGATVGQEILVTYEAISPRARRSSSQRFRNFPTSSMKSAANTGDGSLPSS